MKFTLFLGAACAAFVLPAPAAVIASYAMTAAASPLTGPLFPGPTTVDANATATALQNQAGGQTTGSFTYSGDLVSSWGVTVGATPPNDNSFNAAFTVGNYVAFSISPTAGNRITLTNLTFQASTGSNSVTSNRAFFLVSESSPANFTATSVVLLSDRTAFDGGGGGGGTLPVQASPNTATVPRDYDVSLASLGPVTGTQYFRLYLQAPSAAQAITFDDIVVNGTVSPVPEPTVTVLGLAGLLMLGRRRRHNI